MVKITSAALLVAGLGALGLTSTLTIADEAGPKLPPAIPSVIYFPERAKRQDQQGRVLLQFRVSAAGSVVDPVVLAEEPAGFTKGSSVLKDINQFHYAVPADWEASGGTGKLFKVSILFLLKPCTNARKCQEVLQYEAENSMIVTASPVR